ncbi:MAG: hypothetical protein ACO1OK_13370 [Devosia sp.]
MATNKLKNLPNYDLIRGFQMRRVKQINDFFIEVQLTIDGLIALQEKLAQGNQKQTYTVPGINGGKRKVPRKTSDILNYIDRRVSYSQYAQSLVFVVAIAEDYIGDIIFSILMAYPKKILVSAKGNEGERSVDLKTLIDEGDLEAILIYQATSRLNEVMYASPAQYAVYFQKITGFSLGDHLSAYVELKATRDLLIHNDGIINEIYLEKVGDRARGVVGDRIIVDADYFEQSVRLLKKISSTIYRGLLDKYGVSAQFAESVGRYIV